MLVEFERSEHRITAGDRVELRAAVVNDEGRPVEVTYDVETASDPATDVRWAVAGPTSLEPGQRAAIGVILALPVSPQPPPLRVRLTATTRGGRAAAAGTVVRFGDDDRCAAFASPPRLTLAPDGSVTASVELLNCGPFTITLKVRARREDGASLTIDRPEITLAAGDDPISVSITLRRSDGRPLADHEVLDLELVSDGLLLASTQAAVRTALRPPPRRSVARRVRAALAVITAALLLALAAPVVADLLGGEGDGDGADSGVTDGGDGGVTDGVDTGGQAPTIESFSVTVLEDRCATALQWTVSGDADTTLVRRHDDVTTDLGPVDSPLTDDLAAAAEADGSLGTVVAYELTARADGGSDTRTEEVDVRCAPRLPDLVVSDIGPSGVIIGNTGDGPAGPFVVTVRGTPFDSGGLEPGDSQQFDVDLCEGPVDVTVDPAGLVAESDEGNNSESTTVIC